MILIPNTRTLMIRMQGTQQHMAGWLSCIQPLLHCTLPMKLRIILTPNPDTRANHSRPGRVSDSDFKCEDIYAENAGATIPYGWLAAMDSAPVPKATSPMKLRNCLTPNSGTQENSKIFKPGYY